MSELATLEMLESLDLTEAESKVYLSLLGRSTATAGELAKTSGYSRPKVYEILEKLVKTGLAESFPARPIKFKALDPETAIPFFFKSKKTEIERIESKLKDLLKLQHCGAPSTESEIFINHGLMKCSAKYCELVKSAKKEIYSFLGWVSRDEASEIVEAYRAARKNRAKIKIAYFENEKYKDQTDRKWEKKLSVLANDFYPVPPHAFPLKNPPAKFLLVDEHSVHITLGDYLKDGTMKDVISVHYHNIPAFSKIARNIAGGYFETLFGGFR